MQHKNNLRPFTEIARLHDYEDLILPSNLVYEIHYFNSLFGGHFVIISISIVQFSNLLSPVVIGFQKNKPS